jgi:hypothetical protein
LHSFSTLFISLTGPWRARLISTGHGDGALDVVRQEAVVVGSALLTQHAGGRCACVHGLNPPSGRRLNMANARGRCDLVRPRCSCTNLNLRRWRPSHPPILPCSHTSPSPRWSLLALAPALCATPHTLRATVHRSAAACSTASFWPWRSHAACPRPCPYPTLLTCPSSTGVALVSSTGCGLLSPCRYRAAGIVFSS